MRIRFASFAALVVSVFAVGACAADTGSPRGLPGDGPSTYSFLGDSLSGTTGVVVYTDRVEVELSLFGTGGTTTNSLGGTIELQAQLSTLSTPEWEYRRTCDAPDVACGDLTALMADGARTPIVVESVVLSKAADGTFTATLAGYAFESGVRGAAIEVTGSGQMTGSCREVIDGTVHELTQTARPECEAILSGL
jgi:hypothetical protein